MCESVLGLTVVYRLYDRNLKPSHGTQQKGFVHRVQTLIGITGARMAKYRPVWRTVVLGTVNLIWRPHFLSILIFEVRRALCSLTRGHESLIVLAHFVSRGLSLASTLASQ